MLVLIARNVLRFASMITNTFRPLPELICRHAVEDSLWIKVSVYHRGYAEFHKLKLRRTGLSVVGVLALGFGGWLGGEMVYVKGMAVEAVDKLAKKVEKSSRSRAA